MTAEPRTPSAAWRLAVSMASRPFAWAGGLLVGYVLLVLPSLGQALLETHSFRQVQTAFTAMLFAANGVDVLRPPLPVLGPPGTIPLEFPLFQVIGSAFMSAGVTSDLAMRITGLLAFLASAVLMFFLARRVLSPLGATVALAAFLFNPHAWLYGRTSLIEYLATAGGLCFLLFAARAMNRGSYANWVVAIVGGAVVALVKITTAPIFLIPALLLRSPSGRMGFRNVDLWIAIVASALIGLAWSTYADNVRASNPITQFLAAHNSFDWFFGSLPQRLDPVAWRVPLLAMLALSGSGVVVWGFAATQFARGHLSQRPFLVAVLAAIALTPLTLFNLYVAHDYYWAAMAPFVALAVGMGAQRILRQPMSRRRRLAAVGLAGAWAATIIGMTSSWSVIYATPPSEGRVRDAAAFISQNSSPDDWIVIKGLGWNPALLYYAHRRGFADPGTDNFLQPGELDVDAIVSDPLYGPFFVCDRAGQCTVGERP